ncbi:MAG: hypothetical protein ACK521_02280, partial [bacterium]
MQLLVLAVAIMLAGFNGRRVLAIEFWLRPVVKCSVSMEFSSHRACLGVLLREHFLKKIIKLNIKIQNAGFWG